MLLAILLFISAFSLEGIGTYVSVMGLAATFSFNPVIMAIGIIFDIAKLVTVSFLYKYWKKVPRLMMGYMLPATLVTMMLTSYGVFGYLSNEFQKAMLPNVESQIKLKALQTEADKLQARKVEIDKQISQLPPNIVRNRIKLINTFKEETHRLNKRLEEIDAELPSLQVTHATNDVHAGPVMYLAKTFNIPVEQAIKWVILLIVGVFDPLAVCLILAGNFVVAQVKLEKENRHAKAMAVKLEPAEVENNSHVVTVTAPEQDMVIVVPPEHKPETIIDPIPINEINPETIIEDNATGSKMMTEELPIENQELSEETPIMEITTDNQPELQEIITQEEPPRSSVLDKVNLNIPFSDIHEEADNALVPKSIKHYW